MRVNRIIKADATDLKNIFPDNIVSLIITSPPYNVNKPYGEYDDKREMEEYLAFLNKVWKECYRVLRVGGRIVINVGNVNRKPYYPLTVYITNQMLSLGYLMRGDIIWDKGAAVASGKTSWGSYRRPSNPVIRDQHEYILVFSKKSYSLKRKVTGYSDISDTDFSVNTRSVWYMQPESDTWHPAPFPLELPMRAIKLYTDPGDLVFDPFSGSGTTCLAAKILNRKWIGTDIDENYVQKANDRIKNFHEMESLV